jgi:excisionase family DNA binding protein
METTIRKRLYSVEEFAFALGQKPRTIRQRIWRGELPVVRIGRNVRLRVELVDELIQQGTTPAMVAR